MDAPRLHALVIAASAAAAATAWPANAQCRLCSTPVTTRAEDSAATQVQLEIESSIDFDRLIILGDGEGAAVLRPDGTRGVEGAVSEVGARAMVGTATIRGEAGRAVRVELPGRIDLYSLGGGRISFDEITSDLPGLPRLDAGGRLTFRFGGRVTIAGGAGGDYRGDLPITVEYQ